jgi:3-oxoacyl-[acyl-carrier protein] reductase
MSDNARPVMLIAGATGSIGSVLAREAAAQGWRVVVHGRSASKISALVAELGEAALGIALDNAEAGAAESLIARAMEQAGRIDAVVDCVASGPGGARIAGAFADTQPEAYSAFAELSLVWFQRLAHAALPVLSKQGGTLIGFISDAGIFAAPRQSMIGAVRAGMIGFIRNLAVEVARDGVRVHAISPSFVLGTASIDRLAEQNASRVEAAQRKAGLGLPTPEDIAPAVLFLCGPGARRITGQVISINGGVNA